MKKVKITKEQAEAIERWSDKEQLIIAKVLGLLEHGKDEPIYTLTTKELVQAVYIGYEVEPEFKVGDWVVSVKTGFVGTILDIFSDRTTLRSGGWKMSKERLEEIRKNVLTSEFDLFGNTYISMPKENFDWLIKQAELLGKLREEDSTHYNELLTRVREQNKRYREALKNIYELAEYNEYDNTLKQIVSEVEKAMGEFMQ